ncbi:MAG: hypothetical protein HAW66_01330 [Shewanella sp.]|nr:hypothetical protein [Shewanella sp.]
MLDTLSRIIHQDLDFYQNIGVLLLAMLLAQFVTIPRRNQPLYLFEQLAVSFASKVNHPTRSTNQRIIAGALAAISLIFPLWAVVVCLIELSIYPWFFETLILFLCMLDNGFTKTSIQIAQQLNQQQNAQAKALLAPWCQRDTAKLSTIGINKTCIEKMAELGSANNLVIVFGYLLGGTYLAVLLKMLKQLDLAWPNSNPHFHKFNFLLHQVNEVILFIPKVIWNLLLLEPLRVQSLKLLLNKLNPLSTAKTDDLNMSLLALRLNIELGGPRLYNNKKVIFNRTIYGNNPSVTDIHNTIIIMELSNLKVISSIMLTTAIYFSVNI